MPVVTLCGSPLANRLILLQLSNYKAVLHLRSLQIYGTTPCRCSQSHLMLHLAEHMRNLPPETHHPIIEPDKSFHSTVPLPTPPRVSGPLPKKPPEELRCNRCLAQGVSQLTHYGWDNDMTLTSPNDWHKLCEFCFLF